MSYARSMAIQSVLVHRRGARAEPEPPVTAVPAILYCYDSTDEAWAQRTVDLLRDDGFQLFWDKDMDSRRTWSETIEAEMERADAVLVQWSDNARHSRFVTGEADVAASMGKLFMAHVPHFDLRKLPVDFRRLPSTGIDDPRFLEKVRAFCENRRRRSAAPPQTAATLQRETLP